MSEPTTTTEQNTSLVEQETVSRADEWRDGICDTQRRADGAGDRPGGTGPVTRRDPSRRLRAGTLLAQCTSKHSNTALQSAATSIGRTDLLREETKDNNPVATGTTDVRSVVGCVRGTKIVL